MHIGKTRLSFKCQDSNIFRWDEDDHTYSKVIVKETYATKYLGEIISSDGTNAKNVSIRKGRGFGTAKEITRMLDNMYLGPVMFRKAVVLRDSMLVGTLLTCSEAWYGVSDTELEQLEQVDKALRTGLLEVSRTVPYDLVCLELGMEPLRYIIMKRRII